MKAVIYRGNRYEVEVWVNYLATDKDGMVWCYESEHKPWYDMWHNGGNCKPAELSLKEWRGSLEKI